MPAAAATAFPSSTRPWTRWPRSPGSSSCAKWKSCGRPVSAADRVHRRVEDQLRPLRGPEIRERLGLQSRRDDRVGDVLHDRERRVLVGAEPGLRVEDVLDVRVGVPRAAHERHAGDDRPAAARTNHLLCADAVQHRDHGRVGEAALERPGSGFEPGGLRRDDRDLERRKRVGIVRRRDARTVIASSR